MLEQNITVQRLEGFFHPVKRIFFILIVLFLVSALIGYYLYGEQLSSEFMEIFRETYGDIGEWNPLLIMGYIFLNNAAKSLGALLLGMAIGIPPILFIVLNGFVLGLVAYDVGQTMGLGYVFAALIPHGIIELPAIFLSSAMGIRIGICVIRKLRGGEGNIKAEIRRSLKGYLVRVLPLLFIASIIEIAFTPAVVILLFPQP